MQNGNIISPNALLGRVSVSTICESVLSILLMTNHCHKYERPSLEDKPLRKDILSLINSHHSTFSNLWGRYDLFFVIFLLKFNNMFLLKFSSLLFVWVLVKRLRERWIKTKQNYYKEHLPNSIRPAKTTL